MHQQVPFNGDHSVSGQHLNEINGLSDDCSQQVGINSQQDQHRVIGNNFESDRPMSDCESEEDTDGNEQVNGNMLGLNADTYRGFTGGSTATCNQETTQASTCRRLGER